MKRTRYIAKKAAVLLIGASLMMLALVVARTISFGSIESEIERVPTVAINPGFAERLAESLRIPTISNERPDAFDAASFQAFHTYLERAFPKVHSELERETVARHSLLYTWRGTDPSLRPILLIAHMDVVPVESSTERDWDQAPFGGRIADGFIWGRGAIDNKSAVIGILEAVEMLLDEEMRPTRTVYLAYGHDEEVGGMSGARTIAELLRRRGVKLEMILDEGGIIGDGILPGIPAPVAMVGVAEKGFLTVELSTRTTGGHSSLPPPQSAVGILSTAIARLEQNPLPARLNGLARQLFQTIAPEFPLTQRALFANLWLTKPLIVRRLQSNPATNAMVRTTTAATIFQAGTKDNVLPSSARAVINFRILPGDTISSVMDHVRQIIDDDRVNVVPAGRFSAEPSVVSSTESKSFRVLERTIRMETPEVIVAPYLVVVVTDARHYADLSDDVYRFLPVHLSSNDLERMHGINERIAITTYERTIRTYRRLLLNAAGG